MRLIGDTDLSPALELALSKIVVELHPHKKLLPQCRVQSFIIRKGWGCFQKLCKGER